MIYRLNKKKKFYISQGFQSLPDSSTTNQICRFYQRDKLQKNHLSLSFDKLLPEDGIRGKEQAIHVKQTMEKNESEGQAHLPRS
jgi:hypothetical protein